MCILGLVPDFSGNAFNFSSLRIMFAVGLSYTAFITLRSDQIRSVTQLCSILCDPMESVAYQAPLSMGFSRQEYWSGLPFPSPGDLPNPGIEPGYPAL